MLRVETLVNPKEHCFRYVVPISRTDLMQPLPNYFGHLLTVEMAVVRCSW